MKKTIVQVLGLIIFFGVLVLVNAQIRNQPNTQERRQQPFDREKMLKQFDKDGDGELNDEERRANVTDFRFSERSRIRLNDFVLRRPSIAHFTQILKLTRR